MFDTQRILVPVDYTEVSRAAVSVAIQMASLHKSSLFVLHVNKELDGNLRRRLDTPTEGDEIEESILVHEKHLKDVLALEYKRAEEAGKPLKKVPVTFLIAGGDWYETTASFIEEDKIDLVVTGTHGATGLKGFLLGSKSEQLVHRTSCSVFVVKPQGFPYLRD